jgi:cyclic pyranopterin phosphate synthase
MVNVGGKDVTRRTAIAQAEMFLGKEIMNLLTQGEIHTKKGAVFHTAIIAGIQGAKKTSDLIPLCHPLPLNSIHIDILEKDDSHILIRCSAETEGKTGVEMEALTGASIAALTVYDMCKAISQKMIIREVKLIRKTGGKTDFNLED